MNRIAWAIVITVGALFVLVLGVSLLGSLAYGRGYGWGMGPWMMGPWMMGGGIFTLLFWVFIIAGAVWLIQSLSRGGQSGLSAPGRETPLDILNARYAKGEITKEQFEEMKRDLGL